jgi:glycogen debranching enzyme
MKNRNKSNKSNLTWGLVSLGAVVILTAVSISALSSQGETSVITIDSSSMKHMNHSDHQGHSSHMHEDFFVDENASDIPTISVEVQKDTKNGYNVQVFTTNFRFSPQRVNSLEGGYSEGHAHVYVNDEKFMRLYSEHFHIDNKYLKEGNNTLRVTLNTNDHRELHLGEDSIAATATLLK